MMNGTCTDFSSDAAIERQTTKSMDGTVWTKGIVAHPNGANRDVGVIALKARTFKPFIRNLTGAMMIFVAERSWKQQSCRKKMSPSETGFAPQQHKKSQTEAVPEFFFQRQKCLFQLSSATFQRIKKIKGKAGTSKYAVFKAASLLHVIIYLTLC